MESPYYNNLIKEIRDSLKRIQAVVDDINEQHDRMPNYNELQRWQDDATATD